MVDSIPKTGSSTSIPHTKSETPNYEIPREQISFHDLENIEHNLDTETEIPYAVSNEEANAFR
jgi:hypothetical protein